jgi:F-type H+-transporting ATPase subunit epsilon
VARTRFVAEVLTPEGPVFNEEVEMVSTRTTVGSIGLLAGHEPLLARLEPTELRIYRSENDIVRFAQGEGYVQMAENRALILVEEALDPQRLDAGELQQRVESARRAVEAAPADSEEAARAAADLRRAEAFLAIAGGGR